MSTTQSILSAKRISNLIVCVVTGFKRLTRYRFVEDKHVKHRISLRWCDDKMSVGTVSGRRGGRDSIVLLFQI